MSKITKSYVEKLPLTSSGQKYYYCSEIKGFGVAVGQKKKVFCRKNMILSQKGGFYTGINALGLPTLSLQGGLQAVGF